MIHLIAKASTDDAILAAAARMAPEIRDAFLHAVEVMKDQIVLSKLSEVIARGDANQALAILGLDTGFAEALKGAGLEPGIASFQDAIRDAYQAGAQAAMQELPSRVGVAMSFDLLNPESVNSLNTYSFGLIREITEETKQAIQQIILRAFKEGGHPYEQAREIKEIIGLTSRMEQAVANYRASLESRSASGLREALSRALRDGRYDRTLLRALRTGQGLNQDQIDRLVQRYRERFLQYRARNIARTESIRASNAGQRALWRQAVQQGLIASTAKRKWVASGDCRTCEICMGLNGTVVGLDEEFAPSIMDPPDPHPSCRCGVVLVASSLRAAA